MAEEHVRGRMPLESNPGNRNPAIPPVFDTTGEEDYRRVTPENPLPTKDKDLDERLTAIENKLDSVIENGALNTQLTGSNIEDAIPVKQKNGFVDITDEIGAIPPNSSKFFVLDLLKCSSLINNISIVGRNDERGSIEVSVREAYVYKNSWNTSQAFNKVVMPKTSDTALLSDGRFTTLSQGIYIYVKNISDAEIKLTSLAVMLWG